MNVNRWIKCCVVVFVMTCVFGYGCMFGQVKAVPQKHVIPLGKSIETPYNQVNSCDIIRPNSKRPLVALVLSGGGAKGMAHIPVIKKIEELGIPIDMVVGTSMGAIVGSLYSIGYSTEQMDSLVRVQDWTYVLSDNVKRNRQLLSKKLKDSKYIVNFSFDKVPKDIVASGGVVKGKNLKTLFSELMYAYPDSINFNNLPTPFACVSTDLATGNQVNFHNGKLATAVRASMSIPAAFSPVRIDSLVLVDGGLVDNFPVDIARQMGADYVIGVDVSDPLLKPYEIDGMSKVFAQVITLVCNNKKTENVLDTDVYIHIPMDKRLTGGSFNNKDIVSIIEAGEEAAERHTLDLMSLRDSLGLSMRITPYTRKPYALCDSVCNVEDIAALETETPPNSVSVGFRFDSEELASVIANATKQFGEKSSSPSYLSFTTRLGKRSYGELAYTFRPNNLWDIKALYRFRYSDLDFYNKGEKYYNTTFIENFGEIEFSKSWRSVRIGLGVNVEAYNFVDILKDINKFDMDDDYINNFHSLNYFGRLDYDDTDKRVYPRHGMKWHVQVEYLTDNFIEYNDEEPKPIISASIYKNISFNSRFTLEPFAFTRLVFSDDITPEKMNKIGGDQWGRYLYSQMPFAGVHHIEAVDNSWAVFGTKIRQRMGAKHYILSTINYGFNSNELSDLFSDKAYFGMTCGYGYESPIGPLELSFGWSNLTNELDCYVNIGYTF